MSKGFCINSSVTNYSEVNLFMLDVILIFLVMGSENPVNLIYCQLRARKALMLVKDVPLRTRRVVSLYKVYGDIALLVLNRTLLNSFHTLLALI